MEHFNVPLSAAALVFPAALLLALCLAIVKQETYGMAPASGKHP